MVHASPPCGGPRFIQETARRVSVCGDGQHPRGGSASVGRSVGPLGEADSKDALFLSRGWGDSLQGDRKVTFHSPQTSSEQS